ncbi:unnamed protein product, partial [Closterium sp. NIES-65]
MAIRQYSGPRASRSSLQTIAILPLRSPPPKAELYIVELRSGLPLATYRGQIPGYPATAPRDEGPDLDSAFPDDPPEAELPPAPDGLVGGSAEDLWGWPPVNGTDVGAAHVQAYRQMLQQQQRQVASDIGVAATALVHHFQIVSHGFAAALTPLQLWRVKRHPAVAAVRRSRIFRKHTFDSPVFLRLPDSLWQTAGGQSSAGADVVVGVIDTGIWPEHSSFDDTGLSGTPATWQGTCETSADFSCNGKLIGARKMYNGFKKESNGGPDFSYDYDSPRDSDGHGT